MLFFTVYNEVASLYANVNAQKMGFTDIDGELLRVVLIENTICVCQNVNARKVGFTGIDGEASKGRRDVVPSPVWLKRAYTCCSNAHVARLPSPQFTEHI